MSKLFRELLPFGSLILIICFLSAWQPESFLTIDNFLNVLRRSSVYGIIAVGMTFVIISGGIDLSVGSLLAFCGMVAAEVMIALGGEDPRGPVLWFGTGVGIAVGIAGGWLNGVLLTRLKLQPFIVTLGTMSLFRGIALVMHDGQPLNIPSLPLPGARARCPGFQCRWSSSWSSCWPAAALRVHALRSPRLRHRIESGSSLHAAWR